MNISFRFLACGAIFTFAAFAPHAGATVGDLTTQSTVSINTAYGSAIFTTNFTKPTGTGVFNPFLTVQANGVERGYNTSAGVFDTKRDPQWNHEIRLSDLNKVMIGGTSYYSFLIDVNEPNSADKSQITLDSLKLYTSTVAGQTTTNVDSLGTKRFDLNSLSTSYIKYNDLNSGSGQGDIAFFIPTASFLTAQSTDYVYMYQRFGSTIAANFDSATGGGFEETAVYNPVSPVPEVTTVLPLVGVLGIAIGANHLRRRRQSLAVA